MRQKLEQQCGHLLPSTARGHHHILPSPLSWCCRALGTEMHSGKPRGLGHLAVGTDHLAGPQKIWLALCFPQLLPAKLTACWGEGFSSCITLHSHTRNPSYLIFLQMQLAFPRSMENQTHHYIYHSSICTKLALYHSSQTLPIFISFLQHQKGPTSVSTFRFSLSFKEKNLI